MMEETESETMNSLFIVTNDYPYGRGDSIFVLPELPYLRESFEVTIISTSLEEKIQAELLDGVKYRHFQLELTELRDRKEKYDLGEGEFHLAMTVDHFEEAHRTHQEMGIICFENPGMGIYFIEDPDGYWIEIVPQKQ